MSRTSEYETAMRRIGRSTFNVEVEADVEIVSIASSTATQPYSVLTHPGSPSSSPDMALIEALEADLDRLVALAPFPSVTEPIFETPVRPQVAPTHAAVVARNGLKRRRLEV